MDAKYLEVDEFQLIRARSVKDDSGGILLESGSYKPRYRQESLNGKPVDGMDELYQASTLVRPVLGQKVQALVTQVCQDCQANEDKVTIKFPPLKSRERASAKAQDDYSRRVPGPAIAWLYDILRYSLWFETADQVLRRIDILEKG